MILSADDTGSGLPRRPAARLPAVAGDVAAPARGARGRLPARHARPARLRRQPRSPTRPPSTAWPTPSPPRSTPSAPPARSSSAACRWAATSPSPSREYPQRLAGLILADTRSEPDDDAARANRDRLIGIAATKPASAIIDMMLPKLLGPAHPGRPARNRRRGPPPRRGPAARRHRRRAAGACATGPTRRRRWPRSACRRSSLSAATTRLTPPAAAEGMAGGIAGGRLAVLDGAGHLSNLERPAAFNDAVREFLRLDPA